MKSKLILNLVLLLALLALILFAYLRPEEKAEPKMLVTQLKREDIDRIRIQRENFDFRLEKRNGEWFITTPYQTLAQPLQVDRLLDITMATASDKFPAENLAPYGIDETSVRITLNDETFAFGNINEITNEQYFAGDEHVYLIRTFYAYSLPMEPTELISTKPLSDQEIPVKYDFGKWQVVQKENGAWSFEGAPPENNEVSPSTDDVNVWVNEWKLAAALSVQPYEGEQRGEPFTVQFSNGESATFWVIARDPEVRLVRNDVGMQYVFGNDAGSRLLDPYRVAQR